MVAIGFVWKALDERAFSTGTKALFAASSPARAAVADRIERGLAAVGQVPVAIAVTELTTFELAFSAIATARGIGNRTGIAADDAVVGRFDRSLTTVFGIAVAIGKTLRTCGRSAAPTHARSPGTGPIAHPTMSQGIERLLASVGFIAVAVTITELALIIFACAFDTVGAGRVSHVEAASVALPAMGRHV